MAHQAFGYYFVHRHTAKENTSLLWVVETGAKFHHRAFPAFHIPFLSKQKIN